MKRVLELHRFFCRESRAYIGPYTWRDRLFWPRAWLRFMWRSLRPVAWLVVALVAAPLAAQQDQIDISHAQVMRSAPDVASWPITTAITELEIGARDCSVEFSMKEVWPNVPIPGWNGGAIAYTLWMVRVVGGEVYTSGGIEFWNGTSGTPARGKDACGPADGYVQNWYYNGSWGPLNTAGQLTPGERVGFFVTAGDARAKDVRTVTARSAVVAVPWPGGTGGTFTFSDQAQPPVVSPPPVVVSPPPVIVPPAPPIVSPAPLTVDYTALLQTISADVKAQLALAQDTNAKVTEVRDTTRNFFQVVGSGLAWVGKQCPYWCPAIAGLLGGKAMAN